MIKPTSSSIKAILRLKYTAPRFAILEEVRNTTGRPKKRQEQQARYADMIAMSLWPSDGLEMIGFEIKVSRADWLAELKDTKKAVAVQKFCDRWYLVTPNDHIVQEGELPPNWGWLVISNLEVYEKVKAPVLTSEPITREFLAALLRNATTTNPDYLEVQSKIITAKIAEMPLPKTKSAIKIQKRQTLNSLVAEVRRLKKIIEDNKNH